MDADRQGGAFEGEAAVAFVDPLHAIGQLGTAVVRLAILGKALVFDKAVREVTIVWTECYREIK